MTAPTTAQNLSIDDVEAQLAEPPKPADVGGMKLEGEAIPEDLRGKTVAELVQMQKALEQSLRVSEHGRLLAQQQTAAPRVEEPKPEPELTDEQLAEMYQENPIKAIKVIQAQAARSMQQNLDSRLGTLASGTAAAVEQQMRNKYKDEFDILGSEISRVIQNELPDKGVLSDPLMWDKLIGYVRGLPGNFEKIVQHKSGRTAVASLARAQDHQDAMAGITFAPSGSGVSGGGSGGEQLDDYTKEIARNLGMTEADYIKWRKIT